MIPIARPVIGAEERRAADSVLASGNLAQGPEVAAFEAEFQALVNGRECVAVNSGTSALLLALIALGVGPGDEVIVPSFTFAATANAVELAGATTVFADIEPQTFCIDPASIETLLTDRTRAVIPVHLYGHPAAMVEISAIAQRRGLAIVEDAAQAHAASLSGVPVGSFGEAGAFSFYPTKNMTSGEGGMVSAEDPTIARKVRLLRNQGMEARYRNEVVGFNMRMTDVHAAIGRVQLSRLAGWTATRQANARFLSESLVGVATPQVRPGAVHVFHQYTIRVPGHDRDAFAAELAKRGVGTGVYYPIPVHELPSFDRRLDLPETRAASQEALSLPVHPSLTREQLETIVEAVNTVAGAGA